MQDTLTFYLQMEDLMSGALVKMSKTAKKSFAVAADGAAKVVKSNTKIVKSYDTVKRKIEQVVTGMNKVRTSASKPLASGGLLGSLGKLAPMLGIMGAISVGGKGYAAALKMDSTQKALNFTTDGRGNQAETQIRSINQTYGASNETGLASFKSLSGSYKAPLQEQMKLYEGLTKAAVTFGLSQEQQEGAMLALSQMASKGKVTAEELRGQLAERIPGAFQLAADAMGVTEQKLNKMMETGQVVASDFLPKFATALNNKFTKPALVAGKGPAAVFGRFKNTLADLAITLGQVLIPPLTVLMQLFISGVEFVKKYAIAISTVVGFMAVYASYLAIASIKVTAFTAAQWLLNIALNANPIGLVVAGVAALIIGLIAAYKHSERFRQVIHGLWSAAKQVFTNIGNFFAKIFQPIFKAIDYLKSGDYKNAGIQAALGVANIANAPSTLVMDVFKGNFTKGVGDAYKSGKEGERVKSMLSFQNSIGGTGVSSGSAVPPIATELTPGAEVDQSISKVAASGPRTININGVKFADEIKIVAANLEDGLEDLEDKLQTMMLRILNSATAVGG